MPSTYAERKARREGRERDLEPGCPDRAPEAGAWRYGWCLQCRKFHWLKRPPLGHMIAAALILQGIPLAMLLGIVLVAWQLYRMLSSHSAAAIVGAVACFLLVLAAVVCLPWLMGCVPWLISAVYSVCGDITQALQTVAGQTGSAAPASPANAAEVPQRKDSAQTRPRPAWKPTKRTSVQSTRHGHRQARHTLFVLLSHTQTHSLTCALLAETGSSGPDASQAGRQWATSSGGCLRGTSCCSTCP